MRVASRTMAKFNVWHDRQETISTSIWGVAAEFKILSARRPEL
jgi:hypothetical protein